MTSHFQLVWAANALPLAIQFQLDRRGDDNVIIRHEVSSATKDCGAATIPPVPMRRSSTRDGTTHAKLPRQPQYPAHPDVPKRECDEAFQTEMRAEPQSRGRSRARHETCASADALVKRLKRCTWGNTLRVARAHCARAQAIKSKRRYARMRRSGFPTGWPHVWPRIRRAVTLAKFSDADHSGLVGGCSYSPRALMRRPGVCHCFGFGPIKLRAESQPASERSSATRRSRRGCHFAVGLSLWPGNTAYLTERR